MDLLDTIKRETAHATRVLFRTPAFSAIALITLALGIGATTSIYAVLDEVALQPLAYREPGQLVSVLHNTTVPGNGESKWGLSAGGYFHFRKANRSFEDIGGYYTSTSIITDGRSPEEVRVARITAPIFPVLKARPELGRLIQADDDIPNAAPVVVLSHEYWQRHYGGDRNVIGKILQVARRAAKSSVSPSRDCRSPSRVRSRRRPISPDSVSTSGCRFSSIPPGHSTTRISIPASLG